MRALETAPMIDRFLVMVQREVGERLAAVAGDEGLRRGLGEGRVLRATRRWSARCRRPCSCRKPEGRQRARAAGAARASRRSRCAIPERMFELVRAGFATRRKMLRRALDGARSTRPTRSRAPGIDPAARAETLDAGGLGRARHAESTGAPERRSTFAKLTLSLRVTGVRADGYHELDALDGVGERAARRAGDRARAARRRSTVTGPLAAGVPADETNLAWRAADALRRARRASSCTRASRPARGLGGGSADAAAVLVARSAADASRSRADARRRRAVLPARRRGARARHRRRCSSRSTLPPLAVVIATPPFGCATADVYRAWDELGGPAAIAPLERPRAGRAPRRAAARRVQGARSSDAAGAPAFLAGQRLVVRGGVPTTSADAEAARARVADAVDGQVVVGRTADAGVRAERRDARGYLPC